jgi:hypothetical protein
MKNIDSAIYELSEHYETWSPHYLCISVPFAKEDLAQWMTSTRGFSEADWKHFIARCIAEKWIVPVEPSTGEAQRYRWGD